jgi:hypothetical protein
LLLIAIYFSLSCASIPHYKEVYAESRSEVYRNYTLDEIWNSTLIILVQINYIIKNTDKAGGTIFAEKEQASPAIVSVTESNSLTIIIQKEENNVVLTCQSRVLNISDSPEKEISEFFQTLNKKLSEQNMR